MINGNESSIQIRRDDWFDPPPLTRENSDSEKKKTKKGREREKKRRRKDQPHTFVQSQPPQAIRAPFNRVTHIH